VLPVNEETRELELRDYLRVLSRRRWTVVATVVLVVGAALTASLLQTPVYRATAEVLLQPRTTESIFDPSVVQNLTGGRQAPTEIRVVNSDPVRTIVRESLDSAPGVSVRNPTDTDFLLISATSTDPERAALVANTYAAAYVEHRRRVAVSDLEKAAQDLVEAIAAIDEQLAGAPAPDPDDPTAVQFAGQTPESLQQQRDFFSNRLDQIRLAIRQKTGGAQLQTPADVPTTPFAPTPRRNGILALAVGLLLGVGLAFLRDYLDDTVKNKEDVERAVPGLPVLGLIPSIPGWRDQSRTVLVTASDPKSPGAEAYRALRTSVQFLGVERNLRILQVTSSSKSEGKSTTVANLGVALAQAGQRVVIVDCDLRRPRIHHFFGQRNDVGLTSVLIGEAELNDAIVAIPEVPNLALLPSGPRPPNPSELLAGHRVPELLRSMAELGMVLIDSPPSLPVTDAVVLSRHVDGVLLLATGDVTSMKEIRRSAEVLEQVAAPVLGLVLNGISSDEVYGYSYRYRYAYAYEQDDGADERERSELRSPT